MILMRTGGAQLIVPGVSVQQAGGGDVASWWLAAGVTPIAAYAAKGAASLAASYVNLANPGVNDAAPGVAPTWDVTNGWIFATNKYLTTGIVPATAWSMLIRYSNAAISLGAALAGGRVANLNNQFYILTDQNARKFRFAHGNASNEAIAQQASGVAGLAGGIAYVDGAAVATVAGTFGGAVPAAYIGANNNNGTPNFFFTGNIQAFVIFNTTLSAGNVALMTTAMQAL